MIGHADFTHQSITMATHLNPNQVQLADLYGGREHVKDLSGWKEIRLKMLRIRNQVLARMITRQTLIQSILSAVCNRGNPMTKL